MIDSTGKGPPRGKQWLKPLQLSSNRENPFREAVKFYWQTRSKQLQKQRAAGGSDHEHTAVYPSKRRPFDFLFGRFDNLVESRFIFITGWYLHPDGISQLRDDATERRTEWGLVL